MSKNPSLENMKRWAEIGHETALIQTILSYARSGHATPIMVEQAIILVDKHIAFAKQEGSEGILKAGRRLKEGLEAALAEGLETLRRKRGPTAEHRFVEEPLARALVAKGHRIKRQMRCSGGIIDIYDLTTDEIIECKIDGTSEALGAAAGQLQRYRKTFPGTSLTIAVLAIEAEAGWLADVLREQNFTIIEVGKR